MAQDRSSREYIIFIERELDSHVFWFYEWIVIALLTLGTMLMLGFVIGVVLSVTAIMTAATIITMTIVLSTTEYRIARDLARRQRQSGDRADLLDGAVAQFAGCFDHLRIVD